MYLIDYHTHTSLSPDSESPISAMAQAAVDAGLQELCITDHYDVVDIDGTRTGPFDWAPALAQFLETKEKFQGKLTLKLGLEFGSGHLDGSALMAPPAELDFLIGSVHNLSEAAGGRDFYFLKYTAPDFCHQILTDYFSSMAALAACPNYDSLGHLIYPLRYMIRDGLDISLDPYQEQIDHILTTVIQAGRGIEVNTYNGRTLEPWMPVLKRYRELGGIYITTGSDAHVPENMGKGIPEATQMLQAAGFSYLTTYEKRKPIQIKL